MKRLFLFLFLLPLVISFSQTVPKMQGRVNDYADVLSSSTKEKVEQMLKMHEDSTTNQIAVLVVESLEGYSIEQVGEKTANTWGLGTKKNNNGVLLLFAIDDRKVRIEVGYGLEGALSDAQSDYIIRHIFKQHMDTKESKCDYDAAVEETIGAIIQTIKGEYSAVVAEQTKKEETRSIWYMLGVVGLIAGIIGYVSDKAIIGGVAGAIICPIAYGFMFSFGLMTLLYIFAGFATGFVGTFGVRIKAGSGSSGGSSGGFSGGGGSFGGGGASGSW